MCIFNHVISTVRFFYISYFHFIAKSDNPLQNLLELTIVSDLLCTLASQTMFCVWRQQKSQLKTQNQLRFPVIISLLLIWFKFAPHSDLSESLWWLPHLDHPAVVSREEKMPLNVKHSTVNVAQMPSQLLHQWCNALLVFIFPFTSLG